jgi:hypothetical protein
LLVRRKAFRKAAVESLAFGSGLVQMIAETLRGEESSEESDRGNVEADLANCVNDLPDLGRIDDVTIEVDFEAIKILLGGPLGD